MADRDETLGQVAYEAYRDRVAATSPLNGPWDQVSEQIRQDWIAVGRAVAEQVGGRSDG